MRGAGMGPPEYNPPVATARALLPSTPNGCHALTSE
jgi:hypothetical protein